MDWFERLTGIDPDKGNGSFEALLAALVGMAIVGVATAILQRRRVATR